MEKGTKNKTTKEKILENRNEELVMQKSQSRSSLSQDSEMEVEYKKKEEDNHRKKINRKAIREWSKFLSSFSSYQC